MTLSAEIKYFIFDTESAIGLENGILKFLANHEAARKSRKFFNVKLWNQKLD